MLKVVRGVNRTITVSYIMLNVIFHVERNYASKSMGIKLLVTKVTCISRVKKLCHYVESVWISSYFLSAYSRIKTEYGHWLCPSPNSVWVIEYTDQKNYVFVQFLHSMLKTFLRTFSLMWHKVIIES